MGLNFKHMQNFKFICTLFVYLYYKLTRRPTAHTSQALFTRWQSININIFSINILLYLLILDWSINVKRVHIHTISQESCCSRLEPCCLFVTLQLITE